MRTHIVYFALSLAMVGALSGCGNGYREYYVDRSDPKWEPAKEPPTVPQHLTTTNQHESYENEIRAGYMLLGVSGFRDTHADQEDAVTFAKDLHASLVVTSAEYESTQSGVMPVASTTPGQTVTSNSYGTVYGDGGSASYSGQASTYVPGQTTMSAVPYSFNVFVFKAYYYIYGRKFIMGEYVRRLKEDEARRVGQHEGSLVTLLVRDSAGYRANLFEGDIITAIDDVSIATPEELMKTLAVKHGQEVHVQVIRDFDPGNRKTIVVHLEEGIP